MKHAGLGERGSLSIQAIGLLAAAVAVVLGSWAYVETQGKGPIGRIMAAYLQKQTDCWDPDKPCDWEVAYPEGKIDLAAGSSLGEALADPEFEGDILLDPGRLSTSESGETAPKSLWEAFSEWLRRREEGLGQGAEEIEAILRELLGERGLSSLLALVGGLSIFLLLRLLLGSALAGLRLLTPGLGLVAALLAGWVSGQSGWGALAIGVLVYLVAVGALDGMGRLALAAGTRRKRTPGMAAEIPEGGDEGEGEGGKKEPAWLDSALVFLGSVATVTPWPHDDFFIRGGIAVRTAVPVIIRGLSALAAAAAVALTAGSSGAASEVTTSYVPAFERRFLAAGGDDGGAQATEPILAGEPASVAPDPGDPFRADQETRPYEIAREGGKHSGTLRNYQNRPTAEVQRALRSHEAQVRIHEQKLADPSRFVQDWEGMSVRQQQGMIRKWLADLQRNRELADIMRGILGERAP